jgi:hypothetical protein
MVGWLNWRGLRRKRSWFHRGILAFSWEEMKKITKDLSRLPVSGYRFGIQQVQTPLLVRLLWSLCVPSQCCKSWSKCYCYISKEQGIWGWETSHSTRKEHNILSKGYCVLRSECLLPDSYLQPFPLAHSEDGSRRLLRNVSKYLEDYTASHLWTR